jgi:hypothetical protein
MSADFRKVFVADDRLLATDSLDYAVIKGGQNVTQQTYSAISASSSQLSFNIQLPSESTILSRYVLLKCNITLSGSGVIQSGQTTTFDYGANAALGPWPLHSLFSTMQCTLNNNTTAYNMQDILPAFIAGSDADRMLTGDMQSPIFRDMYRSYADAALTMNNPLGSYANVTCDSQFKPRGAFAYSNLSNGGSGVSGDTKAFTATFELVEPLLITPFLMKSDPKYNGMGIHGVQTYNLVCNVGSLNRVFRAANPSLSVQSVVFNSAQLLLTYLTPPIAPGLALPARNVVPYIDYPRYITSFAPVASGSSGTAVSQSLQLNVIPDKLIFFIRKRLGDMSCSDTDSYYPITGVSLNWNNKAGLLSTATNHELFVMSREAGNCQTWDEWRGSAILNSGGVPASVQTPGSICMLEFGRHIALDSEYAPGSLGSFNIQLNVSYTAPVTLSNAELVMITVNSGITVFERGTTSIFSGILTKADVLSASEQKPVGMAEVKRMTGGGFFDTIKSIGSTIGSIVKPIAQVASAIPGVGQYAAPVLGVMNALGMGQSGGGASGGVARRPRDKRLA